ncbi:hypothetical protein AU359_01890 [Micrococcus luteus]|nr:hypothetical protein AU359_01890 [Micrococcus luteus]
MSMSTCSSTVFVVYGRVGLVEAGRMVGDCASSVMAGAGAPPSHSASRANGTYPAMRRRADRGVRPDAGAVGATGTAGATTGAGAAVVVSCAGAEAGSVSAGAPFRGT